MNGADVNPDVAAKFARGPAPYEGQGPRAQEQDERRMMMARLPSDRYLDGEHFRSLVDEVATRSPDIIRQAAMRKAGAAQLSHKILSQSEYAELLAEVRHEKSR